MPKKETPYPEPKPYLEYKPTWQNIFNTSHKMWFQMDEARKAAADAAYGYFSWNGWVYYTASGRRTNLKVEDIK